MYTNIPQLVLFLLAFCLTIHANLPVEYLTPPRVEKGCIEQEIACVRPGREGGFNIKAEIKNEKLIVHNYGHGGAGYALLFGSVNEALAEFSRALEENPSFKDKPICVIGAGCMGCLTAIELTKQGYQARIAAKAFDGLASNHAAGTSWFVSIQVDPDEQPRADQIALDSWKNYISVIEGNHPFLPSNAAKYMPAYCSPDTGSGFNPYIAQGLVPPPKEVMIDFGNGYRHPVLRYEAIFIDTTILFEELHKQIAMLQIPVIQTDISSFDEIEEAVVFNCTGVGSGALNHDPKVKPILGHLFKLKDQPPMENLQYIIHTKVEQDEHDAYIYYMPKANFGVAGGTFIEGETADNFELNRHEFALMLDRCQSYFGAPTVE